MIRKMSPTRDRSYKQRSSLREEPSGRSKNNFFRRTSNASGAFDDSGSSFVESSSVKRQTSTGSSFGGAISEEVQGFDDDFVHGLWQNEEFMVFDLPKLEDCVPDEREDLIVRKLHLCSLIYDHSDKEKDVDKKTCQMETLKEIAEYVEDPALDDTGVFTDLIFANLVNCFEENAFQPLSKSADDIKVEDLQAMKEQGILPSSDSEFLEPAWPYLKIQYELFLKYIGRMKGALLKELVDRKFCSKLVEKFNSPDHRERDMLKTLVTKIYVKFVEHRMFIRQCINNVFYQFIYETEKHNGISEMLEVLEPIINGFKAPLKPEHFDTLEKSLIPLHKAPYAAMMTFHKNLRRLLNIYMEKDPDKCGAIIIRRIAQFWPLRHGPKQVAMIEELEDILEHLSKEMWQEGDLGGTRKILYRLINNIVGSEHFQVAERGLRLWSNRFLYDGCFNRHIFASEILEASFYQLYFKSHDHWQNNDGLKAEGKEVVACKVGDLSLKVLYGYKKSLPEIYEEYKADYSKERKQKKGRARKGNYFVEDKRWKELRAMAGMLNPNTPVSGGLNLRLEAAAALNSSTASDREMNQELDNDDDNSIRYDAPIDPAAALGVPGSS